MDYETIPESARREAGTEFVAAFARDLAHEWCEIYKAMSNRTTNIVRFQCGPFEYLYDDYASLEATGSVHYDPVMEARLVAVSGYSLFQEKAREDFRLKGWVGGSSSILCVRDALFCQEAVPGSKSPRFRCKSA